MLLDLKKVSEGNFTQATLALVDQLNSISAAKMFCLCW